ncbi:MAG TPA: alpha/beta hydrolase domain-containing protein [Sphingobium sp.]|uniref:alpha/beta hydrolase domain-containing protein n=1 Tax=Sphingobium sp. TaxID=1912891 RepID=UPI002ED0615D
MTIVANAPVTFHGPIPSDDTDQPFRGAVSPIGLAEPMLSDLLAAHDYVEEEYFVSGTVAGQAYRTSLLVRRPADPARFSGLVALETVHVQGALGLWQTSHDAIFQSGHGWVAIGSQRMGIEGPVKMTNPARYAALTVPTADLAASEQATAALMQWSQSQSGAVPTEVFAVDAVSNAIMTQVGAALKAGAEGGPFGRNPIACLLMGGASQTGGATLNYIKEAHVEARLPDGGPIYDGFLPMAAPGWQAVKGGDAAVIHIYAEGDLILFESIGPEGVVSARPDSDAADDRYRCYEVTGASHLPTRGLVDGTGIPQLGLTLDPGDRFLQIPFAPFAQAAFVNLVDWVRDGRLPPRARRIEMAKDEMVRDAFGNAKGGLRSPYVDLPTARYEPAKYLRHLIGAEMPFPSEQLHELYASRADYLQRFDRGIDALVEARWITLADGETLKTDEAAHPPF